MNPEIKKQWVDALRSGKYKQGRDYLRNKRDEFCCLGVLCDLYAQKFNIPWSNERERFELNRAYVVLPSNVVKWAELPDYDPQVNGSSLATWNDGYVNEDGETYDIEPKDFLTIADMIEEEL